VIQIDFLKEEIRKLKESKADKDQIDTKLFELQELIEGDSD
jgi:phage terminase Nu1 subunit (DNA packaging protein)